MRGEWTTELAFLATTSSPADPAEDHGRLAGLLGADFVGSGQPQQGLLAVRLVEPERVAFGREARAVEQRATGA